MRVAITVEQCWHRVPGGTAWSVLELIRALQQRGGTDLVGVAARHRHPPIEPWVPPIPVRHLGLPRPLLYETWQYLRRPSVDRLAGAGDGDVDVVHGTAVAVPPTRRPLVMTIHDLAFLADPSQATRHGRRFFTRGTELARRHATLVACPSQATVDECVAAGFDRTRLRLVPWGVDVVPALPAEIDRVRVAYRLARPYVLFCGTVEPRKNLPRLVEAFRRLDPPGVELVLAGPEGWHTDVAGLLAGLDGRARAIGFVPRADLGPLYAGAEVFAYPSLREGFGLPVLEAMAQGTAVVTARGTATEEVAGGSALLVDPTDPAAIAAAIDAVLGDRALAATLGERGRARAATFTWDRSATLMAAVYDEART